MRTILFLIGLFLININILVGQQKELENIGCLNKRLLHLGSYRYRNL